MEEILSLAYPVIPVVTIDKIEHAIPLAEALKKGGLNVIEVTLRTEAAYEAIQDLKHVNDLVVGAGTVIIPEQFEQLKAIDVDFAVSPGTTVSLLEASLDFDIPYMPGIGGASDLLLGLEADINVFKVYPAMPVGGVEMIKALSAPFPDITFCPTGGIHQKNFKPFLLQKSVPCVGGSWVAPEALIKAEKWDEITTLAALATKAVAKLQ